MENNRPIPKTIKSPHKEVRDSGVTRNENTRDISPPPPPKKRA
ncbi:hypothetical protein [Clostridium lacusfryxellense]|nr:hypothetical protein [Clostridium lacusfryxellense]